jgi:hypothetical protein
MRVDQFDMERTSATHWPEVEYDLSESGACPLTTAELLREDFGPRDFNGREATRITTPRWSIVQRCQIQSVAFHKTLETLQQIFFDFQFTAIQYL